jgi:hypothetical protein
MLKPLKNNLSYRKRSNVVTCSIWPSLVAYTKILLLRTMASEADILSSGHLSLNVAIMIKNKLLSTAR